jgi:hypothetical protein
MRTGRRPRLPSTQTPEERALWETIRAQLSERRRYNLRSNRKADIYIPTIVRHAALPPRPVEALKSYRFPNHEIATRKTP